MRNFLNVLAGACLALGLAAEGSAQDKARRLEGVTWNPNDHTLTWVVAQGSMSGGKFEAKEKITYVIKMDEATMSLNGEARLFDQAEAVNVHALMDLVAKYAAESTVWWEAGKGQPVDGKARVKQQSPYHSPRSTIPERQPRKSPPPPESRIITISAIE